MTNKMKGLLQRAHEARVNLLAGVISYDEALEIVNKYVAEANKEGVVIARRFGVKYRGIDPRGFLR